MTEQFRRLLERATELRQPEVSEVIREIRGENMNYVREAKTGGKGQPSDKLGNAIDDINFASSVHMDL